MSTSGNRGLLRVPSQDVNAGREVADNDVAHFFVREAMVVKNNLCCLSHIVSL